MGSGGQLALPSQFGRYTLLERLAAGGMAEVFRAKIVSSHGFEKVLVVKRILPHLAADRTFVSMFIDEAKLTAQLMHPKIVQVLDFGEVQGQYFIALEYIDGCDGLALLRACAARRIRLPLPLAAFLVAEILDALDYAHNARDMEGRPMHIVHRDISPSNVFISRRGDVKLGDFGIARANEREAKTQAGTLKGKYGYMSPEQVVGMELDGRSDLFAVGIVLAEAFMGRRLFTARNDLDVLLMVRDVRLGRLDRYAGDLPPALDRIVRKALRREAYRRYQTAAEFRNELQDHLFAERQRVGSADLSAFVADLFDDGSEALLRLQRQGRPLAETSAPKVPAAMPAQAGDAPLSAEALARAAAGPASASASAARPAAAPAPPAVAGAPLPAPASASPSPRALRTAPAISASSRPCASSPT
jgi:serine/threonine protein kinase